MCNKWLKTTLNDLAAIDSLVTLQRNETFSVHPIITNYIYDLAFVHIKATANSIPKNEASQPLRQKILIKLPDNLLTHECARHAFFL